MKYIPEEAFILAAGQGSRLRPYTDNVPKPMVNVCGKPIIDHTLAKLKQIGVKKVIVNLYYLGEVLKDHLSSNTDFDIVFSEENEVLETGGGLVNALPLMSGEPLLIINGDALWNDDNASEPLLSKLINSYNPDESDIMLALQRTSSMKLTGSAGDYSLDMDGKPYRRKDKKGEYMFTGIRMCNPKILHTRQVEKFSFLELMDESEKSSRLSAVINDGNWYHISTPEDLEHVNSSLSL